MKMDGGWADYLHTSFYGEHVLFPGLRLTSVGTFICAALLAAILCLLERYVIAMYSFSFSRYSTNAHPVCLPSRYRGTGCPSTLSANPACAERSGGRGSTQSRRSFDCTPLFLSLCRLPQALLIPAHFFTYRLYMLLSMTFQVW